MNKGRTIFEKVLILQLVTKSNCKTKDTHFHNELELFEI